MPDERLITELESLFSRIVDLGAEKERTRLGPNLLVTNASPTGLANYILVKDDRDGDNILALKVPGVIYNTNDLVNVLFIKGGEAIAFQQGSGSSSSGLWGIVSGTSTDIFYNAGDVGIGKAVAPDARLELLDTAQPQLRLTHTEDTKFTTLQVDTNHDFTIDPSSTGLIKLAATVTIPDELQHEGDVDTKIGFTTDVITDTVGSKIMLRRTNAAQDLVEIGDISGGGDVDINFNNGQVFIQGSDGAVGINKNPPAAKLDCRAETTDPIPFRMNRQTTSTTGTVGAARLELESTGTPTAPFGVALEFNTDNTAGTLGNKARISGGVDGASNQGFLLFETTNATNTLTDRMKINSAGDVGIGGAITTISAQLHIDQSAAGGAQPVLQVTQTDISEEIIWYEGESSAGSADMSLVDVSDFTTAGGLLGWVKIKVEDNRGVGGLGTIDAWMPFYAIPTA